MRKFYFLLACCFTGFFLQAQVTNQVNFTFTVDPLTNTVAFVNTSALQSDGIRKAYWHFGDGSIAVTPPLAGITHHYGSAGTYQVCLKIYKYNANNLADSTLLGSECKSVAIQQRCTAGFQWTDSVSANPFAHHVKFLGFGDNNANKPIIEVCWNFGDGSDTCIRATTGASPPLNIRHKYAQNGTYNVCIRIKYDGGCVAEKCNVIVLGSSNVPDSCASNFNIAHTSTINSLTRKFVALPWHSNLKKPVRICWDFGDGKDTCIQYPTSYTGDYWVEHRYLQPGQYNVCVNIKYDGGCEKRTCKLVQVNPLLPADSCKADFSMQPVTATPLGRKFFAQPWHNLNKKPVLICWTFGDGKDTCIQYSPSYTGDFWVEHKYALPGQYEVCVKIRYEGGCESRKCRVVAISQPTDTCYAELNEVPVTTSNLDRKFYIGLMPNRRAEKICWTFGDGTDTCIILANPIDPQQLMITHHYGAPGNYRVCAKVFYAGGCIVEKCKTVNITVSYPNICGGFMVDSLVSTNTIRFKATSIYGPNDNALSYNWTFGDGTAGTGQVVNHTYPAPGRYNVCLMIRTASGCETKICKPVAIAGNSQPQLVLTPNPVVSALNATFISIFQQTISVRIYNANGLMVRSYVRNANVGTNTWTFSDVATLPTGVYSVVVQSANQFATAIFFKQ